MDEHSPVNTYLTGTLQGEDKDLQQNLFFEVLNFTTYFEVEQIWEALPVEYIPKAADAQSGVLINYPGNNHTRKAQLKVRLHAALARLRGLAALFPPQFWFVDPVDHSYNGSACDVLQVKANALDYEAKKEYYVAVRRQQFLALVSSDLRIDR